MPKLVAVGEVVERTTGRYRKVRTGWGAKNFVRIGSMLSAPDLCRERGWDRTHPWVMSSRWCAPRQILCVRVDRVHMAKFGKGQLNGMRPAQKFPPDVHEVPAP